MESIETFMWKKKKLGSYTTWTTKFHASNFPDVLESLAKNLVLQNFQNALEQPDIKFSSWKLYSRLLGPIRIDLKGFAGIFSRTVEKNCFVGQVLRGKKITNQTIQNSKTRHRVSTKVGKHSNVGPTNRSNPFSRRAGASAKILFSPGCSKRSTTSAGY